MAYPERLAMLMRENFRNHRIDVLNRGVGGQEATTELPRFDPDVLARGACAGDLAGRHQCRLPQGRSSISTRSSPPLRWGCVGWRSTPIDVVIDGSAIYSRRCRRGEAAIIRRLVARIARVAEDAGVNVFRRFDLMRHWVVHDGISIGDLVREGDDAKTPHERLGDRLRHAGVVRADQESRLAAEGAS